MQNKRKIAPRDSWIALKPGESIQVNKQLGEIWHKKTQYFREVRGNILAVCFQIEFILDQILCETLFPGLDNTKSNEEVESDQIGVNKNLKAMKDIFDELFLKNVFISFNSKIRVLKKLVSQISTIQKLVLGELIKKLDQIREIRNRFAHYPIVFYPVGEISNQKLDVILDCPDKKLKLDQKFFEENNSLFSSTQAEIEEVFKKLIENTKRI